MFIVVLPVCDGGVEYLVCYFLYHLSDEFFLHGVECLGVLVCRGGSELLLEVLGVVGVVCKSDVYGH